MDSAVLGHESRGLQARIRQGFRVRVFRMTICLAHISALQYWRAVRCGFRPKPRAARVALPQKRIGAKSRLFSTSHGRAKCFRRSSNRFTLRFRREMAKGTDLGLCATIFAMHASREKRCASTKRHSCCRPRRCFSNLLAPYR